MINHDDRGDVAASEPLVTEIGGHGRPAESPGPPSGVGPDMRLGSDILLRRRYPRAEPALTPEFDRVSSGYDPEQVDRYVCELIEWARRQTQRADSAEQMLRAAITQLGAPPEGEPIPPRATALPYQQGRVDSAGGTPKRKPKSRGSTGGSLEL